MPLPNIFQSTVGVVVVFLVVLIVISVVKGRKLVVPVGGVIFLIAAGPFLYGLIYTHHGEWNDPPKNWMYLVVFILWLSVLILLIIAPARRIYIRNWIIGAIQIIIWSVMCIHTSWKIHTFGDLYRDIDPRDDRQLASSDQLYPLMTLTLPEEHAYHKYKDYSLAKLAEKLRNDAEFPKNSYTDKEWADHYFGAIFQNYDGPGYMYGYRKYYPDPEDVQEEDVSEEGEAILVYIYPTSSNTYNLPKTYMTPIPGTKTIGDLQQNYYEDNQVKIELVESLGKKAKATVKLYPKFQVGGLSGQYQKTAADPNEKLNTVAWVKIAPVMNEVEFQVDLELNYDVRPQVESKPQKPQSPLRPKKPEDFQLLLYIVDLSGTYVYYDNYPVEENDTLANFTEHIKVTGQSVGDEDAINYDDWRLEYHKEYDNKTEQITEAQMNKTFGELKHEFVTGNYLAVEESEDQETQGQTVIVLYCAWF